MIFGFSRADLSYFLSAVNSIRFDLGGDDDQADKMSCRYSIMLLVVFCVVVSTKQYVGDPIDCWVSFRSLYPCATYHPITCTMRC